MNIALPMLVIGLVFGGGIGFMLAAANGISLDGHDHGDPAHHDAGQVAHIQPDLPAGMTAADLCTPSNPSGAMPHDHATLHVLPPSPTSPTLDLELVKDPAAGWNLHIQTQNFIFSPRHASLAHVAGEGHAHVYVNGVKLGRYYGDWVHLDKLPNGEVEVEVTLNANDHRPLAVGDQALAARVTLQN